jgi:uncharacterized protein (DUF4415 family)
MLLQSLIQMPSRLLISSFQAMVPLRSLRGRPKSPHKKQLVSIRYSPEVLNYFKSFGVGWQARMDAALKEYATNHPLCDAEEA